MKFTEGKAAELAQTYYIPDATINTWRYRGNIPDRYKTELEVLIPIKKKDESKLNRLYQLLSSEMLSLLGIARATNIKRNTINDAIRGKGRDLSIEEFNIIRTQLFKLRRSLSLFIKTINSKGYAMASNAKKLIENDIIVWFVVFQRDRNFYETIKNCLNIEVNPNDRFTRINFSHSDLIKLNNYLPPLRKVLNFK